MREVQAIVKDKKYRHIKVFGTRHSFNTIADTRANLDYKDDKTVHICTQKLLSTQFMKANVAGEAEP